MSFRKCIRDFRAGIEACLDLRVDAACPAGAQYAEGKGRACHAFSAGEGHAAVVTIKRAVFLDLDQRFFHAHLPRVKPYSSRWASDDAFAAARAGLMVDGDTARVPAERLLFAGHDAALAGDADVFGVPEPDFGDQPFRVLTPFTAKRAAFEEDRRTDAVSVVDRESLDVEHVRGNHKQSPTINRIENRLMLKTFAVIIYPKIPCAG
jgi:hypothetical protein